MTDTKAWSTTSSSGRFVTRGPIRATHGGRCASHHLDALIACPRWPAVLDRVPTEKAIHMPQASPGYRVGRAVGRGIASLLVGGSNRSSSRGLDGGGREDVPAQLLSSDPDVHACSVRGWATLGMECNFTMLLLRALGGFVAQNGMVRVPGRGGRGRAYVRRWILICRLNPPSSSVNKHNDRRSELTSTTAVPRVWSATETDADACGGRSSYRHDRGASRRRSSTSLICFPKQLCPTLWTGDGVLHDGVIPLLLPPVAP